MTYYPYPLHVINGITRNQKADSKAGVLVFYGDKPITYETTAPRLFSGVPYVPLLETMAAFGVQVHSSLADQAVTTQTDSQREVVLNVDTGAVSVTTPLGEEVPRVLDPKPITENGIILVPAGFVTLATGLKGAWFPDSQIVRFEQSLPASPLSDLR